MGITSEGREVNALGKEEAKHSGFKGRSEPSSDWRWARFAEPASEAGATGEKMAISPLRAFAHVLAINILLCCPHSTSPGQYQLISSRLHLRISSLGT